MNATLTNWAAHLLGLMRQFSGSSHDVSLHQNFDALALELFALQYQSNPAYQKICDARMLTPANVQHWTQIPFVPTAAFKELELTSIPAAQHTAVFHSSGTTEQKPSRHFHCAESLALYETSLWQWFLPHVGVDNQLISLTPDASASPRSSLVHMFETIQSEVAKTREITNRLQFHGTMTADGVWEIQFDAMLDQLQAVCVANRKLTILGTAFSFVHLLDYLAAQQLRFDLPTGSRVMETGGYKNRSRVLPKVELHQLITQRFGISRDQIICEYGMSELSSQAYDNTTDASGRRCLHFPPWTRVQIISPETRREVADGETGIIRILDLANVFSVAAIQTEDLGIRRGEGFELVGRAELAEARGCSLMAA